MQLAAASEGGYNYEFVDTPMDMFLCNICHLVSRNPYVTNCCSHIFCKSCIDEARLNGFEVCPMCRQPTTPVPSVLLRREINRFCVFCTNKTFGCSWIGQLDLIEGHLNQCNFSIPGPCQYSVVGCKDQLSPNYQVNHNNEKIEYHLSLVKQKVTELNKTTTELLSTKKKLSGTEETLEDTKKQLLCAEEKLAETKKSFAVKQNTLQQIKSSVAAKPQEASFWPIKLSLITIDQPITYQTAPLIICMPYTKGLTQTWYSHPFFTHNGGYKMCLQVTSSANGSSQGKQMSVALCLMKGPYDDQLAWPLCGKKFNVTLLNQISDSEHHTAVINFDNSVNNDVAGRVKIGVRAKGRECSNFISHADLDKATSTHRYTDTHLFFNIEPHEPSQWCFWISCIIFVLLLIGIGVICNKEASKRI